MPADVRGGNNKTRSVESLRKLQSGSWRALSCEGRPVAGAIKGLYILRAAADTAWGSTPAPFVLYISFFEGCVQGFAHPT